MKFDQELIFEVIETLNSIEKEHGVPRNIRIKLRNACIALECDASDFLVKVDQSLQELDEISDDQNIPIYAKTQIWSVVSKLQSLVSRPA